MPSRGRIGPVNVTWDQVFSWRMKRQYLDAPGDAGSVEVVRRLAGVQAQVASSAEFAVAVRQAMPRGEQVKKALAQRHLVKTWAMRGTLHVLAPDDAGAYLSLMAAGRSWERPSWQKASGVSPAEMESLREAVGAALNGDPMTREQLVDHIAGTMRNPAVAEGLRSGWGSLLKPLAWQGVVCHGPSQGTRVTFTRPDGWFASWGGVPEPAAAARTVIPAYLGAHGPAGIETFGNWLSRGVTSKRLLKEWFAAADDVLTTVDVEGQALLARAEDVDELAATKPSKMVRLVGGFDHYVLGPGTGDPQLIPPHRRGEVSKAAGWIAPVVIWRGRVAGTWEVVDGSVAVTLFPEADGVPARALAAEVERITPLVLT